MNPPTHAPGAIECVPAAELTVRQLHDLLKLRVDIFVVEQACPYPELDGRDLDSGTVHFWISDAQGLAAYIRLLSDAVGHRIGRVATRADARGNQLARKLMEAIHDFTGSSVTALDAQSYLRTWYESLGYEVTGPEFIEDGIPHLPMERSPMHSTQSPNASQTTKSAGRNEP